MGDTDALLRAMWAELNPGIPVIMPMSFRMSVLLGLVSAAGTVADRKAAIIDRLAYGDIHNWLETGYRMYRSE